MGNSNEVKSPSYSIWGLILGQAMKQKEYTQNCPQSVVEIVQGADLTNKKVLVTGASSGLGKEMTKIFAACGAHVLMVSRSLDRLKSTAQEIEQQLKDENKTCGKLSQDVCDLGDVFQVTEFCKKLLQEDEPIYALINNGGALPTHQILKPSNLEETVAVHVVSPFILSVLLQPLLLKGKGRIIHQSSAGAYSQKLYPELIEANFLTAIIKNSTDQQYKDGAIVYAQCKRAMMELSDMMAANTYFQGVQTTCCHPGWCQTPGLKPLLDQHENYKSMKFRPALDGAYGCAYLACIDSKFFKSGEFYYDGEIVKKHQTCSGTQASEKDQQKIWNYCSTFLPVDLRQKIQFTVDKKK